MRTHDNYEEIEACFQTIKKSVTSYFQHVNISELRCSIKAKDEICTNIDQEIEALLTGIIRKKFPTHGIVGEEGTNKKGSDGYIWYVDPIDNTVGLVSGERDVSTSVSLKKNNEHLYSVVINVQTGDVFEANKRGSFKNGKKITPFNGKLNAKTRAVSTCGYVNPINQENWHKFMNVLLQDRYPVRISGGAALDLCFVAEGIHAAHVSLGAHPWDVEAGFHIVEAAGGVVEVFQEFPERKSLSFLASANRKIHKDMKKLIGPYIEYT